MVEPNPTPKVCRLQATNIFNNFTESEAQAALRRMGYDLPENTVSCSWFNVVCHVQTVITGIFDTIKHYFFGIITLPIWAFFFPILYFIE